jgi:hypothetical protein
MNGGVALASRGSIMGKFEIRNSKFEGTESRMPGPQMAKFQSQIQPERPVPNISNLRPAHEALVP